MSTLGYGLGVYNPDPSPRKCRILLRGLTRASACPPGVSRNVTADVLDTLAATGDWHEITADPLHPLSPPRGMAVGLDRELRIRKNFAPLPAGPNREKERATLIEDNREALAKFNFRSFEGASAETRLKEVEPLRLLPAAPLTSPLFGGINAVRDVLRGGLWTRQGRALVKRELAQVLRELENQVRPGPGPFTPTPSCSGGLLSDEFPLDGYEVRSGFLCAELDDAPAVVTLQLIYDRSSPADQPDQQTLTFLFPLAEQMTRPEKRARAAVAEQPSRGK